MGDRDYLLGRANDPAAGREGRLEALRELARGLPPPLAGPGEGGEVNNHVHTIYSFSPYSPSMAALRAREAGLEVAGSVDHDSISASREMVAACAAVGIGGVTGCELRVGFGREGGAAAAAFAGRKINSPDSAGIAYMTIQGVPANRVDELDAFLAPIRARRVERTRRMAEAASDRLAEAGMPRLDFDAEVLARSMAREGGGLTERHLLAAAASRLVGRFGRGPGLVEGLERSLGIRPSPKAAALLADPANPYLEYDLLGLLKMGFLDGIFEQPDELECPDARAAVALARSIGAVPAYAYLGDVGESPTGDKKAEKFEDEFLDELFEYVAGLGYLAIAYMPPRNSRAQLERVQALCARHGLMEISGVDINQPRQSFSCPELREARFRHLVGTTWALVAHERLSSIDPRLGLFSPDNPLAAEGLGSRIAAYARAGRALAPGRPGAAADVITELAKGRYTR
ncbi:MAG TPA: PHP domain-containing protein [Spirochaetales bacterium]|nr:PHP domain-containing protein [Spirochaetales bacterium]HRY54877.1 PHP domain-containing protein [Spirochaetia bacterium]HRZ63609.1 PHP domain-containing protein [Spirochaetia bacterium]